MADPALQLLDVSVRYRAGLPARAADVVALDQVSLSVAAGECVAIVGEPGAGKTTLLLCAAGILNPDAGTVVGPRAEYVSRHAIAHPLLCVSAALELAASLREFAGSSVEPDVPAALRRAGIEQLANMRIGRLDAGMRARALVAHALLGDPRVLCLDDALQPMDDGERRHFAGLLEELQADGMAVVIAAREESRFDGFASRLVELRAGQLASGSASERVLEIDVALPRHAAAVLSGYVPAVRRRGRALRVSLDRISSEEVLSACVSLGISVYGSRVITAPAWRVAEGGNE